MLSPPTPLHRHTLAAPIRHPVNPSSRHSFRPTYPISRLLVAALATTVGKTWVLDHDGECGGAGWLILAFWAGRVGAECREKWTDRKGKRKEFTPRVEGGLMSLVTSSTILAVQSISFVFCEQSSGPLAAIVISLAGPILAEVKLSEPSSIPPFLPAITAVGAILFRQTQTTSEVVSGTLPVIGLLASTLLLEIVGPPHSPFINPTRVKSKPSRTAIPQLHLLALAGAISAALIFGLWQLDMISRPFPSISIPPVHLLAALAAGLFSRYIPTAFPSSDISRSPALRTPRDRIILLAAVLAFQSFAFPPAPAPIDVFMVLPLILTSIVVVPRWTTRTKSTNLTGARLRGLSVYSVLPVAWRPHLQTILRTPTSSKIFYFLLLNLAYMGVQMGYGIFTNSLGLISDAIHMLFDCLGLGVGLWASVAATWKPDGRYTFGYSRVETLSGFVNGLFLILISIFIMFEAIQRVIDPPDITETNQLLLVSTVGLIINLFGMYATGGHHHHGHGHGHDHGHAHSNAIPVNDKKVDHRNENGHNHGSQKQSHGHHIHTLDSALESVSSRSKVLAVRRRSSAAKLDGQGLAHSHSYDTHDDSRHHTHSRSNGYGQNSNNAGHDHDDHDHDDCGHVHGHNREAIHAHDHAHDHENYHAHDHDHHSHDRRLNGHDHNHENDLLGPRSLLGHNDNGQSHHDHHDHNHDHDRNHSHDHNHDRNHDHKHDHDHDHELTHHGHTHSHNMRGVFLHVLADTLGSVGVIVSTILIRLTGWTGFDPIASLFIAGLIAASVIPLVIESGRILCLDVGDETEKEVRAALAELKNIDGLSSYSSPRFWPRCEGELVGSIHIQLAPTTAGQDPNVLSPSVYTPYKLPRQQTIYANSERVVGRVERMLKGRIRGLTELVVQVEGGEERIFCSCMTGGG